jgi:hypothetical protein
MHDHGEWHIHVRPVDIIRRCFTAADRFIYDRRRGLRLMFTAAFDSGVFRAREALLRAALTFRWPLAQYRSALSQVSLITPQVASLVLPVVNRLDCHLLSLCLLGTFRT